MITVTQRAVPSYNVRMTNADAWDPEFMSNGFLFQAQDAERYLSEVRRKVRSNSSYQCVLDDHLARFCVLNYLHGRTFLSSRQTLLKELKRLAAVPFAAPTEAYSPERFEHFRQQYLAQLISRFGEEKPQAKGCFGIMQPRVISSIKRFAKSCVVVGVAETVKAASLISGVPSSGGNGFGAPKCKG